MVSVSHIPNPSLLERFSPLASAAPAIPNAGNLFRHHQECLLHIFPNHANPHEPFSGMEFSVQG
jgi:hypothetical protein